MYIYIDIATGMSSCSDKSPLQEVLDNIRVKAHNALMKAAEATCCSSAWFEALEIQLWLVMVMIYNQHIWLFITNMSGYSYNLNNIGYYLPGIVFFASCDSNQQWS